MKRCLFRVACGELPTGSEHFRKTFAGDIITVHTQQKPIKQSVQGVIFRQMIAGSHKHERGERTRFLATPKDALIQRDEQRIQDGAVRIQQFIQKNQRRLR